MSWDIAIRVSGLGKRYTIGQLPGGYGMLRDVIADRIKSLDHRRPEKKAFWALRDINLEVERGETLGIIGHNGAGKTTLLRILSRITPPTVGEADLNGRVGALLEVGTGFHPELTGRENVYLNGAILSMTRADIARKFDEIVEFADVARFIDTPVKRYSSGMQLRLAFSVAAHLEPEILVIDEVLSVGDLAFQDKCLGRMEEVASEGRTVLFVSHNLTAVRGLCSRAMLLSNGRTVTQGPTDAVIEEYVKGVRSTAGAYLGNRTDRIGSGELRFLEVAFESNGAVVDTPTTGQDIDIVLAYETADGKPTANLNFAITIYTLLGEVMLHLPSEAIGAGFGELPGSGWLRCRVPRCPLPAGQYIVNIYSDRAGVPIDWVQRACELTVIQGDFYGTGRELPASHRTIYVDYDWTLDRDRELDGIGKTVDATAR
jgi:lipopolysaccharide transport system ATP-binding protein